MSAMFKDFCVLSRLILLKPFNPPTYRPLTDFLLDPNTVFFCVFPCESSPASTHIYDGCVPV